MTSHGNMTKVENTEVPSLDSITHLSHPQFQLEYFVSQATKTLTQIDFKNNQKLSPVRQASGSLECYHQKSVLFMSDWQDSFSSHNFRHRIQKKGERLFLQTSLSYEEGNFYHRPPLQSFPLVSLVRMGSCAFLCHRQREFD